MMSWESKTHLGLRTNRDPACEAHKKVIQAVCFGFRRRESRGPCPGPPIIVRSLTDKLHRGLFISSAVDD
jgi:hypothetical protein